MLLALIILAYTPLLFLFFLLLQFNDHMMMGGSDVFLTPSPFRPTIQSIGSDMIQRSSYDPYDIESNNKQHANGSTSKWMSTPPMKMRIIRKGAATDPEGGAVRKPRRRAQAHQDESQQQLQQALGVVRVCSDCNTTKTPLWRSGPCGPKVRFTCSYTPINNCPNSCVDLSVWVLYATLLCAFSLCFVTPDHHAYVKDC